MCTQEKERPRFCWSYARARLLGGLQNPGFLLAILGLAVSVGTVVWIFAGALEGPDSANLRKVANVQGFVLLIWVIGAPVYFFFEFFLMEPTLDKAGLDRLKAYQERARNVWLAVAAVLAFVFGLAKFPG